MHIVRVTVNNNCMRLLSVLYIGIYYFCRCAGTSVCSKIDITTVKNILWSRETNTVAE
jgi:hypothetical protein